jgi:hypothetical protein
MSNEFGEVKRYLAGLEYSAETGSIDSDDLALIASALRATANRLAAKTETLSTKRYVIKCLECGVLDEVSRKNVLTCSPACRVRAHRNGTIKRYRAAAESMGFPVTLSPRINALIELRPDLAKRVQSGELTEEDARPEIIKSFWQRVLEEVKGLEGERTESGRQPFMQPPPVLYRAVSS